MRRAARRPEGRVHRTGAGTNELNLETVMKSNLTTRGIAALAISLFCAAAWGQAFPNKPIRIVVPFDPEAAPTC